MELKFTDAHFLKKRILKTIMRFFIFLSCTIAFGFSPNSGLSQNSKIKIIADKTITVDEVFQLIQNQTDYKFIYRTDLFKNSPSVNLKKGAIRTFRLLDETLSSSHITYDFIENTIILSKKPIEQIYAEQIEQQITITGTVTDVNGNPLPGVNVLVGQKGSSTVRGVATDFDGKYSIGATNGEIIRFSFLGFQTQNFTVTNQTTLNVVLKEDVGELNEVVITGFQKISKERATGSYDIIDKSELDKPATSISERLVGMVAGLQSTVNTDGTVDFEIRGQSSLLADQEPLIVYDGFPIEGGFETINPSDVESITILKDAAAASIWGAKSANGVIVIVSKKAAKGKTNISVSSFLRASGKLNLDYSLGFANSSEIIDYQQKGFDSNFFGSPFGGPPPISSNALSPFSQAIVAMNEARLGRITNSERDATLARLRGINNQGQIEDYLLNAPITKQYNINISGGSENMLNKLSLLFEDNRDYFKGNKVHKYLINYNTSVKITDRVKFDFGGMLQFNDNTRNGVTLGDIASLGTYNELVNSDGSLTDMSYLKYYRPNLDVFVPFDSFAYNDWSYNPITEIRNRDLSTKQINARIQTGLTVDIIDGLTYSSKFQYESSIANTDNYYSDKTFDVRQFINETSGPEWNYGEEPTQLVPSGGILNKRSLEVNAYNFRNQVNFIREFKDKHAINFVAGTEFSNRVRKYTANPTAFGYNNKTLTTSELLGDVNSSSLWDFYPAVYARYFYKFNLTPRHSFSENTDRFFSLYGNLGYTYDGKYTLNASYRTDASNIIADDPKYRYDPFWSVGLGWQMNKENFMSDVEWLDRLNVRATYGVNGNIDKSTSFKPTISLHSALDVITQENTAGIASNGNPTLRWEKTKSLNLGVDFSALQGKLNGTINVYNKKGTDLIVSQSIASVNGSTSQKFNNGTMLNKGFEIELGTSRNLKENDIQWRGSINYSYNKNEITSLFKSDYHMWDMTPGGTASYVEGHDANTMWSFVYGGMYNFGSETSVNMQPSIVGIDGLNNSITTWATGNAVEYMEAQGSRVAPTNIGMRHSFKIYDFDLSFIITGKFGHVFRRQSFNYPSGGITPVNSQYSEVAASDGSDVIPIPDVQGRYYFYNRFYPFMNYLTEDASHIRFQEVNLTYNLPSLLMNKIGLNSAKVYAQANNLGTILWNDFDEDPEYPVGTIKPQTTVTLGVQLNF